MIWALVSVKEPVLFEAYKVSGQQVQLCVMQFIGGRASGLAGKGSSRVFHMLLRNMDIRDKKDSR